MKALVFTGPSILEMQDVPEPQVAPDEALVHVRSAGICGSELHGARTPGFRVPPLIMGHEFAGVTNDGDRVVINPILSCGTCDLCRADLRHICRKRRIVGVHCPGGFAEQVAVPRSTLRLIPEGMSWTAAALVEPAANAQHAWNLAGAHAPGRVAVVGCGPIGLLCLLTARAGGASRIDVTDLSPGRRAEALRLGADSAGTALDGEYDVIFDAVGAAGTRAQSVEHQRPGGTAVWLGLAEPGAGFDAAALVRGEKSVMGSFAYSDEEFASAAQRLSEWDLDWTDSYPLIAGAEVFTALMNGAPHPVKAMLTP